MMAQDTQTRVGSPRGLHIICIPAREISPVATIREVKMTGLVRKSLDMPEETRPFEGGTGQLQLVNLDGGAVGRATFLPGWRWSEHVKPIAKTDSCQAAHMGYFVSGRMKVVMDDGEEMEYGPGDFAIMAPGHDEERAAVPSGLASAPRA
jgi:quercetin dioxygenase-like cupin family protein